MRILALDPGVTTGYALAVVEEEQVFIAYREQKFSNSGFYNFLHNIDPDVLICESFKFRQGKQKTGVELKPVEFIGIARMYTQYQGIVFREQPPSVQGKQAYWSDEKLKAEGLYDKTYHHGRSAVKHLLQYTMFNSDIGSKAVLVDMDWLLKRNGAV